MTRVAAVVCSFCLCALALTSGQQPPSSSPRQVIGSGTTAIVVDAVVRDGKGNPITDLRKEDFQLLEDGVEQEIGDVTSVAGTAVAPEPASPSTAPVQRRHVPSFTAIVFSRLSPEARPQAYKGALACLDSMQEGDFVGVFAVDGRRVRLELEQHGHRRDWPIHNSWTGEYGLGTTFWPVSHIGIDFGASYNGQFNSVNADENVRLQIGLVFAQRNFLP